MTAMTRALVLSIALLSVTGLSLSCKANLETNCVDGTCGPSPNGECAYPDTGGLPCDVYSVLAENCQGCHASVPTMGAPFSLTSYADTQAPVPGLTEPIWQEMRKQIQPGASPGMPFGKNPPGLARADRDVLEAWFTTCDTGTCAQGHGTGTGSSSSASSSSASSSSASSSSASSSSASSSSASSSSASSTGTGM